MAAKTTKKKKNPSQKTINANLMKAKALEKIVEHNRDYLKLDVTLPLGNTALKKVHTNQWLWTTLPPEFDLANWNILAKKLNSTVNRWEQYVRNKWYIESCDISVTPGGKAEMKLGLNAFASTFKSYSDDAKSIQKAYTDAIKKNTSKSTSSSKSTSNALATNNGELINQNWVKQYSVPSVVVDKVKQCCKVGNSEEENVRAWHVWMDNNIQYQGYTDSQKSMEQLIRDGKGNCCDNSRMFRYGCLALGVKCVYVHGFSCCAETCANHQFNKVYFSNGKSVIVDNGRDSASWGSHWGNCSGGTSETTQSW